MESIESLRGEVEDIIYRNDDTGFAVVSINADGEEETVVGDLADVNVGEILELYGEFASHPTFGRQFKVKTATRVFPSDEAGMIKYLSGGVLPGIGVKMAERIVAECERGVVVVKTCERISGRNRKHIGIYLTASLE